MSAPRDTAGFKQAMRDQWNESARAWNDYASLIHAWLRDVTEAMLGMAAIKAGDRVLDVAAGAGDQTLAIAARVGSKGHVLATDLSPDIQAFAKQNAARAGWVNVDTRVADGEELAGSG